MEEMEPRLDPCKEVAGEGGGVMKLYPGAALRRSLIIESNSAVAVFRSSVMSVSDVMRSERLEVELRWLQASTACCSSTGWIARATDKNCCLSTWLARSTASRSCSSKPCCSSSTWRRQASRAPPTGSCFINFRCSFCSSTAFFFISVLFFR